MTAKELNRDIKKLASEIYRMSFETQGIYFEYIGTIARKEYIRLLNADSSFGYMNITSIKIMVKLNLSHRFVQLHTVGSGIDLTKLI